MTIDLKGHTLSGNGTGSGIRVGPLPGPSFFAINRTVIKRGTIAGFGTGVLLSLANGAHLEKLDLTGNGHAGASIGQVPTFTLDGPRLPYEFLATSFRDNVYGIYAFDTDNVTIERSRFEAQHRGVYAFSNANDWTIRESRFARNSLGQWRVLRTVAG